MARPEVGDQAPDFDAPGTDATNYSLASLRGRTVVLAFYPGDGTAVCTKQLKDYSDSLDEYGDLDALVLGLSPQSVESHEAFRTKSDIKIPLVYDEGKKIGEAYGILGPLGFYRRSVFVVGPDGRIVYAKRGVAGLSYVKMPEIAAAVRSAV